MTAWKGVNAAPAETCTTGGGGTGTNLLANPGFESGATSWTSSVGVITQLDERLHPRTGSYYAWLDGYGTTHTDTLSQTVTVPRRAVRVAGVLPLRHDRGDRHTAYDKLTVSATSGGVTTTQATYSNANASTRATCSRRFRTWTAVRRSA